MAPGVHGPSEVFIHLDGYDLTPEQLTGASFSEESETAETTGLGDTFRSNAPTGIAKVTLELNNAIFNTCSGRSHDILSTGPSTGPQVSPRLAVLGMAGTSIGSECEGFEGAHQVTYQVAATLDDLQRANATYEMTGARDSGHVLHPLGDETTDNNTQSTSVNWADYSSGGTLTTEGGVGHFHMSAFDGGWDDITVKIQDSSNDVAYADLLTFSATSSTGNPVAERVTVAGEVQQYTAAAWAFSGAGTSGTATFFAMFSRGSTY